MRFAVVANIQGNLQALTAVLDAIEARRPRVTGIICAGDIVGLGPQPDDVIGLMRERGIESVRGNYDDAVAVGRPDSGTDFPDVASEAADAQALKWTRDHISPANLEYLQNLPRDMRVSPGASGLHIARNQGDEREAEYRRTFFWRALFGGVFRAPVSTSTRVLVVHGSPRALNEFVREDTANSILAAVVRNAQTDILITAHTGDCFRRDSDGVTFIGAGSVSNVSRRGPVATYAVVSTGDAVEVEFEHVPFDGHAFAETMRNSELPPRLIANPSLRRR